MSDSQPTPSPPHKPKTPPKIGCQQDPDRTDCPLVCKYNHFQSEDLTIDAWELKCVDCGWRDTVGFRSDEAEEDEDAENPAECPQQCPFCLQKDLPTGQNPCTQ